jgi:hypothetical protein
MRCTGDIEVRDLEEVAINIDPIQAGGRLTPEAMKAIIAYGDGYSVCDNCRKPFRLDAIRKPPIDAFHRDLARFTGMDEARVMPGARRGFQAVADTYVEKGSSPPSRITRASLQSRGRGGYPGRSRRMRRTGSRAMPRRPASRR